ncbi:MAG: Spy/CpxP family protein refolding chaperone [Myxococcaceae bacterium]
MKCHPSGRRLFCLLAILVLPLPGLAQEGLKPSPGVGAGQAADPIGRKLVPPELIMSHQTELGIDEHQRDAILKELERAQAQFPRLQWQLQAATEQLVALLEAAKIDEAKALAQASEVMRLEVEIKKMHLGMLIRIRNLLSETQRVKLLELRRTVP